MSAAKKLTELGRLEVEQIFAPKVSGKNPPDFWLAHGQEMTPQEILNVSIDRNIYQVIDQNGPTFDSERLSSAIMMFDQEAFRVSPMSSILQPQIASTSTEEKLTLIRTAFNAAVDKSRLLESFDKVLGQLTKSSGLKADALTIADELITNAIYNAPYVSKDNQRSGISRIQPHITMGFGKFGEFFVGSDGDRLVIGVKDPFGSLNINALLARIRNCYANSVAATMNMEGNGGAGIGSYMIFNSSSSLYVLVEEDDLTLICSVIRLKGSSRVRSEAPKNLHCREIKKE